MIFSIHRARKKNGFTIVDLMTTLLVIGVLVGIAGVSYSKYSQKSRLAESYTLLSAISQTEISYYLTHKEFYYLSANPGWYQYSLGSMYSAPNYERSGWDVIGLPVSASNKIMFSYTVYPGKTNAAGTEQADSGQQGGTLYGNMMFAVANQINGWRANHSACSNRTPISSYVTVAGKSQYNWFMVHASRDFDSGNTDCTYAFKVVDTAANGNVNTGNPIVTDHIGD